MISEIIKNRLLNAGVRFNANDNIYDFIEPGELELLQAEVELKFQEVLKSLVIDIEKDWNTKDTARRVAKMYITEIFSGRYRPVPKTTAFPNVSSYDQLYVTGPITIRSTCAHHLANISGKCYIGVYPGNNVIGLSKFNRLADWIASRPTIQEEMTMQIADLVEQETEAQGVAVLIQAEHGCMTTRGVKEHESAMTTSVMRGVFQNDSSLKQEFFNIISRMP